MHQTKKPELDHGLWWAIELRARNQKRSEGAAQQPSRPQASGGTADAVLAEDAEADFELELALRHFHDQHLSFQERGLISSEMQKVLLDSQPRQVGPVGRRQRIYRFDCRDNAFSVAVGEGRTVLAPDRAARLAGALGESNHRHPTGSVAA